MSQLKQMSSAIRLMLPILSVRDKERVKEKTKDTPCVNDQHVVIQLNSDR